MKALKWDREKKAVKIRCDCAKVFWHSSSGSKVTCPACGKVRQLQDLRGRNG